MNRKQIIHNLPLAGAIYRTIPMWRDDFSPEQRGHATLATTVTLGRLGLRAGLESMIERDRVSRPAAVVMSGMIDVADNIDGRIARAGNACTPLGAELDPLADKADFLMQEVLRVGRGELPVAHAALRFSRDVLSTVIRHKQSNLVESAGTGGAHVAAAQAGKVSSAFRSLSLRINDIAPHSRSARVINTAATALLGASLAVNAYNYWNDRSKSS